MYTTLKVRQRIHHELSKQWADALGGARLRRATSMHLGVNPIHAGGLQHA